MKTIVTQSLGFQQEKEEVVTKFETDKRTELIFTHDHKRTDSEASEEHVLGILRRHLSAQNSELPILFDQLVYSLRSLKHSQIVNIYYSIKSIRSRKFFQDALPLLKTDAGVTLKKDIINTNEVSKDITDSWFSSLAFYKNPTRGMLVVLSSFITKDATDSALLGISGLASTFCANNPNCLDIAEFKEVLSKFESLLGTSCETKSIEDEQKMVLVLKGIRNMGHLLHSKETLKRCFNNKLNSILIRVSVIEAVRKWELSCSFTDSGLMKILKDQHEDSEVRINAYLAIMTCPTENSIASIKNILMDEEINQVGSFIWTHMTNLQETQSKIGGKLFMKRIIGSDALQNKWRSDVRKFSRNLEVSHFFNDYKVGATFESNIIFSEKSYIPRSFMLNLTLSLFGENINLVEIGGRIEGFENILEDMFGPDGYFKDDTIHNFLKTISSRNKRETENNLETFGSNVKINNPKGSMYVRYFGKDIKFISFSGIPRKLEKIFKNPFNLFALTFEDTNANYEKSSMFLDGSIIVPTVTGFPLNMTAKGTKSIQLKSQTKINIQELLSKGKAAIDAEILPSITFIISGAMSVDAFTTKTSIKSVSTIHSSTYLGGSFDIIGKRLVQFQIKVPNDRIEIYDMKVEFYKYKEGQYEEINSYQKLENFELCTPDTFDTIFGLSGCGHFSYHHGRSKGDPDWFFAGPSKASLVFRKTDTFKGLIAKYSWNKNNESSIRGIINDISLVYDTPGSSINRKTILAIKYDDKETFFDIDMIIPALNFKLGTKYDWTQTRKVISAKLSKNDEEIFEFTQSLIRYSRNFEGISKIILYDEEIIDWSGILYIKKGKYSLDAVLMSKFHDKIVASADFTKMKGIGKMQIDGILTSDNMNVNVSLVTRNDANAHSVKGDLSYKLSHLNVQSINFSGKLFSTKDGEKNVKKFNLDLNVSISLYLTSYVCN